MFSCFRVFFCCAISSHPFHSDPFRATTPSQVRKVLGHGHGRARRLSLRQWRGANGNIISNKLNIRHSRLQYNGGTGGHSGTRSHGHNTPSGGSGKHQHYSNTTPSLYFTPAYGGDPNMGAGSGNGPGIGSGGLFGTPGSSKGNNRWGFFVSRTSEYIVESASRTRVDRF